MSPSPQDNDLPPSANDVDAREDLIAGTVPPEAHFEPNAQPNNQSGFDGAEPMKRDSFSKSIARATRQKYEAIARAQAAETKLAEILAQQRAQPRADIAEDPRQPSQHQTYAASMADEDDHAAMEKRRMTYETNLERALDRYPDYHAVVNDAPVTRAAAAFIAEMESGPDIAYYLGHNRDDAIRIARLPLVQQGYELAKIEAQLQTPHSLARTQSKWSEPIKPVRPAGNAPERPLSQLDMVDYARTRNKQIKAGRQT